jgi:hypothetical protein
MMMMMIMVAVVAMMTMIIISDTLGKTIEHLMAECSLLSVSTFLPTG